MARFVNSNTPQSQSKPGDIALDFVGPSYQLVRKKSDVQRTINLAPTHIESGGGLQPIFFQSVAGLKTFSIPIPPIYFWRSLVYPFLVEDTMSYPVAGMTTGFEFVLNPDAMHYTVAGIPSGTLAVTIAYISYTNERDVSPDSMSYGASPIQGGTLATTINFVSYTNERDVSPDSMQNMNSLIQSGSLVITIEYINYTNQRDHLPDTMNYPVALIQSGSLA